MKFYIDGKKVTKKAVEEEIGKESLKGKIKEAKEIHAEDPYVECDWFIGCGMLTIEL